MNELEQYIKMMIDAGVTKIIISNPTHSSNEFKKLVVEQNKDNTDSGIP